MKRRPGGRGNPPRAGSIVYTPRLAPRQRAKQQHTSPCLFTYAILFSILPVLNNRTLTENDLQYKTMHDTEKKRHFTEMNNASLIVKIEVK